MYEKGGNAVDAIVACILAVETLAPYHSGIGGGGFALIRTPEGDHTALSFRGAAPVSLASDGNVGPLLLLELSHHLAVGSYPPILPRRSLDSARGKCRCRTGRAQGAQGSA